MELPDPGQYVPYTYDATFIGLSYLISAVGCWTALELLHRRTAKGGISNWALLAGAATAMGAVAIWSMHFIGMLAIVMGDGAPDLQLVYSPAYSAGSFFLPIVVVGIAFFVLPASGQGSFVHFIAAGTIVGAAICGMHYLGVIGISNYHTYFDWRNVLGSAVISVVAATVALGVFFRLKSAWTNAIWKRALCALALACAVSIMHWTAMLNMSYQWTNTPSRGEFRSSTAVWACVGLALACCVVLVSFAVFWRRLRRVYAHRARQVVIATAMWDPEGHLMVNANGLLPCRKVTNAYLEQSFKDTFTTEHPVFSWIFRLSRDWTCIEDLVSGMRHEIDARKRLTLNAYHKADCAEPSEDYATTFKKQFCIAAQELAHTLQSPLTSVGVLHDRIFETGTISTRRGIWPGRRKPSARESEDAEQGYSVSQDLGRGQLLFLVRHLNRHEAAKLQTAGFDFAPAGSVADQLAQSMQVTTGRLLPHLEDLYQYRNMPRPLEAGVYLSLFALRPVVSRGFDVLAVKGTRNLLPSVKLSLPDLQQWQLDYLTACNDWEVSKIQRRWRRQVRRASTESHAADFLLEMLEALGIMSDRVGKDYFRHARLIAAPFKGPCETPHPSSSDTKRQLSRTIVIAFRLVGDVHWLHRPNMTLDAFVPYKLFMTQQHAYAGDESSRAAFAARVFSDFGHLAPRDDYSASSKRFSSVRFDSSSRRNRISRSLRDRLSLSRGPSSSPLHAPFSLTNASNSSHGDHPDFYDNISEKAFSISPSMTATLPSSPLKSEFSVPSTPRRPSISRSISMPSAKAPIAIMVMDATGEDSPSSKSDTRHSRTPSALLSSVGFGGGVQISQEISVSTSAVELSDLGVRTDISASNYAPQLRQDEPSMMEDLMGIALSQRHSGQL